MSVAEPSDTAVNGTARGVATGGAHVTSTRCDGAGTRGIGAQPRQPAHGSDPVHASTGLHDRAHFRMREPVRRPVVDEPAAIEPTQSIGSAQPQEAHRISQHTADAIVGESLGDVVDEEGNALGPQGHRGGRGDRDGDSDNSCTCATLQLELRGCISRPSARRVTLGVLVNVRSEGCARLARLLSALEQPKNRQPSGAAAAAPSYQIR